MKKQHDFLLIDQGSVVMLTPKTQQATDWIDEHISEDASWLGAGLVIEHRYADDIINGIIGDGMDVAGIRA